MNLELINAIKAIEKERMIPAESLFEAIEGALVAAYKREFTDLKNYTNIQAEVDRETGEMTVYLLKEVVEEVMDPNAEISLEEAKVNSSDVELGDMLAFETNPDKLGRLAAQSAKAVIMQKLADAEKTRIQSEFTSRIGELATGVVQRKDKREVVVDIGRAEAILASNEQVRNESYYFNQRMKFYILKVDDRHNRPVIFVSRSHPGLVKKLFEQEVPEIADGTVEIVSIAREAGVRTKIAVASRDPNVDALGACVGQHGMRVQAVMTELGNEKIDIIEWDADPEAFISHALSPAKVQRVHLDPDARIATVIVPDQQLSLAIGREGQNAKLAAGLVGCKIDIKSESQFRVALEEELMARFEAANQAQEEAEASAVEEADADSAQTEIRSEAASESGAETSASDEAASETTADAEETNEEA